MSTVSSERRNVHNGRSHVDGRAHRRKGRLIDAHQHACEASELLSRLSSASRPESFMLLSPAIYATSFLPVFFDHAT